MPELPEVEHLRRRFAAIAHGATISAIDAIPDPIVFTNGTTHTSFIDRLRGATILSCERYGKYMYTRLAGLSDPAASHPRQSAGEEDPDDGCYWFLHLGMTGTLRIRGMDNTTYLSSNVQYAPDDQEWPPKYAKYWFTLTPPATAATNAGPAQYQVAFCDPRRLGKCFLVSASSASHLLTLPPLSALGFDPLLSMPPLPDFQDLLARRRGGTIKAVLLDQAFAAGVGNWIADEVLYQAGVHPQSTGGAVAANSGAVAKVHEALARVITTACEIGPGGYPSEWLFHYRWAKKTKGKKAEEGQGARDALGRRIEFVTVGGRTSAFVPAVQSVVKAPTRHAEGELEQGEESELSSLDSEEEADGVHERGQTTSFRTRPRTATKRAAVEDHGSAKGAGGTKRIKSQE